MRDRSTLPVNARKLELVDPEEITQAILSVIHGAYGISREEAVLGACRLFGFKRTTQEMLAITDKVIKRMVKRKLVSLDGGLLHIETEAADKPLTGEQLDPE